MVSNCFTNQSLPMPPICTHSESSDVTRNADCFCRFGLGATTGSALTLAASSCIFAALGTPVALPLCKLNWPAHVDLASWQRATRRVSLVQRQIIETACITFVEFSLPHCARKAVHRTNNANYFAYCSA